jgi:hypothetical protein
MAEWQRKINPSKPDDVKLFRSGIPLSLIPGTQMRPLLLVDSPDELDRLVLYVVRFEPLPGSALSFPVQAFWSVRAGVDCEADDAYPMATAITSMCSASDLGAKGRRGYLGTFQGFPATSYALYGCAGAGTASPINVIVKGFVSRSGNCPPTFTLGSAVG